MIRDHESRDLEAAAHLAYEADAYDDRPDPCDYSEDFACTWCGGEGICDDGSDPLGNCPDSPHRCHACGDSGDRKDQRIF